MVRGTYLPVGRELEGRGDLALSLLEEGGVVLEGGTETVGAKSGPDGVVENTGGVLGPDLEALPLSAAVPFTLEERN